MDHDEKSVESLVLNESFQRYCLGTDEAAKIYWEGWLMENEGKKTEFLKAKELYFILNGGNHSYRFEQDKAFFLERLIKEGILDKEKPEAKIIPLSNKETNRRFSVYQLLGAASVLLFIVMGTYAIMKKNKNDVVLASGTGKDIQKIEKEPGGNKATLTLANGTTIELDSVAKGIIMQQGSVQVINLAGLLTYKNDGKISEVLFNTISTPKGGQYQLLLADGSKVWLNASSSLRFPTIFNGPDRSVELKGEGYFEVAHNASMPFHVKVNDLDVQVLGTHFNVMAYGDEKLIKTTLLQGKVKVQKQKAFVVLSPGQQAQAGIEEAIKIVKDADLEATMAWKNGLFQFDGADIGTVMRHIGRWYDIETELVGDMKNIHLSGKVSRNLNLSQVLQVLEESGIEIKREGNRIIASPKP